MKTMEEKYSAIQAKAMTSAKIEDASITSERFQENAQISCTKITSRELADTTITFEKLAKSNTHYLIAVVERTVEPKHQTEIVFEEGKDIPIPDGYELKTVKYFYAKPKIDGRILTGTINAETINVQV
jgi:hypothetical protein